MKASWVTDSGFQQAQEESSRFSRKPLALQVAVLAVNGVCPGLHLTRGILEPRLGPHSAVHEQPLTVLRGGCQNRRSAELAPSRTSLKNTPDDHVHFAQGGPVAHAR